MVEYAFKDAGSHPSTVGRTVHKWGPYADTKRFNEALREAKTMKQKLERVWPCTFLVAGYDWQPPAQALES